jgi:hypothetical protein
MNDEITFVTMTELGRCFGLTSHQIGRKLKEIGLRTADGKPSQAAFQGGLCSQRWSRDHENYCWAWHQEKTSEALRRAGLKGAKDQCPRGVAKVRSVPDPAEGLPPPLQGGR